MFTDSNDRLDAAYLVQHDLLKRTLHTATGGCAALTDINGSRTVLTPAQSVILAAENAPKLLEVFP